MGSLFLLPQPQKTQSFLRIEDNIMGLISIFIGAIELIAQENIVILVKVWVIKNQALGVLLKKLWFFREHLLCLRGCVSTRSTTRKGFFMGPAIQLLRKDNSEMWHHVLATSMKLGSRGVAHVEGVSKTDLKEKSLYSNILLINRTASPLSWFAECKDRKNHSSILLPYSFLPSMAAEKLRYAAEEIKKLLGDYDAMHVRRGDVLKTRKDRFGVERSLHPHLDRDTRPEFILCRIAKWVLPGRTLFIASNERTPGYFSPLAVRYKLAYSSNYSNILDPLIENNYELFMVERLILMGAKNFIKTMKEDDNDLSLSDDPKKNTKKWEIPVYTRDEEC